MEICKAPTLRLKALNKHTHIMYIEIENVIQKKKKKKEEVYIDKCSSTIINNKGAEIVWKQGRLIKALLQMNKQGERHLMIEDGDKSFGEAAGLWRLSASVAYAETIVHAGLLVRTSTRKLTFTVTDIRPLQAAASITVD